ncbi:MAG TPA: 50S ribosomal protein L13 [Candidatus Dojkabacteria bacterium]|nr:50S ribosomal protein L13 [Candidatus Dojkabacteria bacterium]
MQKTTWNTKENIKREWYLIDAKDRVLGRTATKIASLLIGKNKVGQVPNLDCGDFVVVINAKDIKLTNGKNVEKMYYSHTMYPGGFKEVRFDKMLAKHPTAPIQMAVEKMLPKNKLRASMLTRLFIYADENHKHSAQQPKPIKF